MKKGYVEIELDGKLRKLRFDFNAIADLEEYFNKGLQVILAQENIGFNTIRAFYWIGLKWQIHGLTLQTIGGYLQKELENGKDLTELVNPIVEALQRSGIIGDKKADQEETEEEIKN